MKYFITATPDMAQRGLVPESSKMADGEPLIDWDQRKNNSMIVHEFDLDESHFRPAVMQLPGMEAPDQVSYGIIMWHTAKLVAEAYWAGYDLNDECLHSVTRLVYTERNVSRMNKLKSLLFPKRKH